MRNTRKFYDAICINIASFFILMALFNGCSEDPVTTGVLQNPSPHTSTHSSSTAIEWMDLACNIVSSQRFSPPKASRFYNYASITIYECVRNGMPGYNSLSGQLTNMPQMPQINNSDIYDWPSVIIGAMPIIYRRILDTVFTITETKIQNLKNNQEQLRRLQIQGDIVDRSLSYGALVADKIVEWSQTDMFRETRTMVYVVPPRSLNRAFWEPTDSVNVNPLEPYWKLIRCFAMPNANSCDVTMNIPFDSASSSSFYNEALEVKTVTENLSQEQKDIALFWADGGGTSAPPGHWLSIIAQICNQKNIKLDRAAEIYVMSSIAMADAFISCWESKYRYNLLRHKTYIRDYIGPANWNPFITTPPFPEYTSGHSVQSSAVSEILTSLLGASYSFTDTTHLSLGYNPRTFSSFYSARDEAAVSRLYGGIHYRQAVENGKQQGKLVGQTVLSRVRLRTVF